MNQFATRILATKRHMVKSVPNSAVYSYVDICDFGAFQNYLRLINYVSLLR